MKKQILFLGYLILFLMCMPGYLIGAKASVKDADVEKTEVRTADSKVSFTGGIELQKTKIKKAGKEETKIYSASSETQALKTITKAIKAHKKSVDISSYKIKSSKFDDLIEKMREYDPVFYACVYDMKIEGVENTRTKKILQLNFVYKASKKTTNTRYSKMKTAVKNANASIKAKYNPKTKEQAVVAVHDYIVLNTQYYEKTSSNSIYSAYGTLVNKKAVCAGYAETYKLLLDDFNVKAICVTSDSMNHEWNMVNLSGSWYHVDVTWDDPYSVDLGDLKNYVSYEYFLKTDQQFKSNGQEKHYSWKSDGHKATSTAYKNIPASDNILMWQKNGSWYIATQKDGKTADYRRYNFKCTKYSVLGKIGYPYCFYNDRLYYYNINESIIYSANIPSLGMKRGIFKMNDANKNVPLELLVVIEDTMVIKTNTQSGSFKLSSYAQRTTDNATSLKLNVSSKTIKKGKSFKIKTTVGPSWASKHKVTFQSMDPSVATVSAQGNVTGKKKGTTKIKVKVDSLYKVCKITVK